MVASVGWWTCRQKTPFRKMSILWWPPAAAVQWSVIRQKTPFRKMSILWWPTAADELADRKLRSVKCPFYGGVEKLLDWPDIWNLTARCTTEMEQELDAMNVENCLIEIVKSRYSIHYLHWFETCSNLSKRTKLRLYKTMWNLSNQ